MIKVYRQMILLIGLIVLMSTGCSLGKKQSPSLHDFGVPVAGPAIKSVTSPAVTVDAPKWFWDTGIHYRLLYSSPTTVRSYALDRWIAPPPELFQQQLVTAGIKLTAPLTIRLLDFEQQFDSPDRARVILRFIAETNASDSKPAIKAREFKLEQATSTPDAAGAVKAFADVVRLAVAQVNSWLEK